MLLADTEASKQRIQHVFNAAATGDAIEPHPSLPKFLSDD
jgi:hypothetical protein